MKTTLSREARIGRSNRWAERRRHFAAARPGKTRPLLWMSRSFAPMDRPWSLADPNQRKERPMIPFVMAGHEGRVIHNLVLDHDPYTRIMVSITLVSPHEPCKKPAASRPCSISGSIAGDARRFLRDDGFPSSRPPNRSGLHYSALPRVPAAFAGTKSSACPSHRYFGRTFLAP